MLAEDVPTIVSDEPDANEPPDRLLAMALDAALDAYTHPAGAGTENLSPLGAGNAAVHLTLGAV